MATFAINECKLLLVDGDRRTRTRVKDALSQLCCVHEACGWEDALAMLAGECYQVLLTAAQLPDGDGIGLCARASVNSPRTVRIVTHESPTLEMALTAINKGHIWKFLQSPYDSEELQQTVRDALHSAQCLAPDMQTELHTTNEELRCKVANRTRDVVALNEELRKAYDQLHTLTPVDPVTGLYNRRAMMEQLEAAVRLARRYDMKLACVVCDIDGFGMYNTTHGHEAGNQLLVFVAKWLQQTIREVDTPCHLGKDCFTLILPNTDYEQATRLVTRMKDDLRHIKMPNQSQSLQLHFGIAEVNETIVSADKLLHKAVVAERNARSSHLN
ncbi:MAG: diguanylate cyclase [bacterium]